MYEFFPPMEPQAHGMRAATGGDMDRQNIDYFFSSDGVDPQDLDGGFFENWPDPPSTEVHSRLLRESDKVVIAREHDLRKVIGFVTAITDHVLAAYIPCLEVLPTHRGRGVGRQLVEHMVGRLGGLYMIDLLCDPELQDFYQGVGMRRASGMMIRNYGSQSGELPR